jgi:hypothetical protein
MMQSGAAVRQLGVFQSRPVSRLRYTQLGVVARPLTRTTGGEPSLLLLMSEDWVQGRRTASLLQGGVT